MLMQITQNIISKSIDKQDFTRYSKSRREAI